MRRACLKIFIAASICSALSLGIWLPASLAAPVPGTGPAQYQTGPYATTSGAVHVRGGPGAGFWYIGILNRNEIVPILGVSADRGWWFVSTRWGEGWVSNIAVTVTNVESVAVRDPGPIGTVTAGVLSVRSGAGPTAPLLATIGQGDQVLIIGRNEDGSWLQIRWANGTGWVSASFLTTTGTPAVVQENVPLTANAPFGIVLAAFLNVRTGPGINFASLGQVPGGTVLPIVGRSADNQWFQVETVFGTGWVAAGFVAARNEFGAAPVATADTTSAAVSGPIGIVNTGALNLRSGPGAQFTSLGTLAGGEEGRIVGRSADWSWWLMETRLGTGWASSRFIIARGDTSGVPFAAPGTTVLPSDGQGGGTAPPAEVARPVAFVATGALHIRSGPNSAFPSIGSVLAGTRMPIIGQSPDRGWWQVESAFGTGWVSKRYVIAEGSTAGVPVVS